jgi:hypothetical protein
MMAPDEKGHYWIRDCERKFRIRHTLEAIGQVMPEAAE